MPIVEPTTGKPAAEHKPLTDREYYVMHRDQALYTYERAVENAQYLLSEIDQKRNKRDQLNEEIAALEGRHKEAIAHMEETEAKVTRFIKSMRHYRDDA